MAADGGDRRDADQMPPPTLDEVLQSERRHRREPGDIYGDRVSLGAPLQLRILAPRPGRNDENINAADFGDQVACSCSGLGDIANIEPNRRRYSRMLRCHFEESLDAARGYPNGVSTTR